MNAYTFRRSSFVPFISASFKLLMKIISYLKEFAPLNQTLSYKNRFLFKNFIIQRSKQEVMTDISLWKNDEKKHGLPILLNGPKVSISDYVTDPKNSVFFSHAKYLPLN